MRFLSPKNLALLATSVAAFGFTGVQSHAVTADLFSAAITTTYDSGTGAFAADGFAQSFNFPSVDTFDMFSLSANIDSGGNFNSGSFFVSGVGTGFTGPNLLTGTINSMAAHATSIDFFFTVTGGDLASFYGGGGTVILSNFDFPGSFAGSFDNMANQQGLADIKANSVPENSSTFALLGLGMIALACTRRMLPGISSRS